MNAPMIIMIIVFILVCAVLIILPPSFGKLPPILDEQGNEIKGSLTEKSEIEIDGGKLGITIISEDINQPVLLVCGGGPGISEYLLEYMYPSVLPKHFTVCYFDYRGTGRSFDAKLPVEEMTTTQYLRDTDVIADYLRERFSQDKIYIMGHSFGTYIALNTVKMHPEKYVAYLAMSQITEQKKSEFMAYDYMYNRYKEMGNRKMCASFEEYPIHQSEELYAEYRSSGLRDEAMHDLGVGTTRDMHSVISGLFFKSLRCMAYTIPERINIWRGKVKSNNFPVSKDAFSFNAFEQATEVEIPIYFFAGKYDYTCCESLQKEFFDTIKAPDKAYYLFSEAAHSPIFECPKEANLILDEIISK